ncbi:alanine racemase, partial [Myxococcota bacterium]|nr:alanine racemase [Myxococcota bacterium]MBU1537586.1 alanine racemase [Myxococcota bacterium]
WTVVTKVMCGMPEIIDSLIKMGVKSFGDSRVRNIRRQLGSKPELEAWYLRVPTLSAVEDIVTHYDVSLNSELQIILKLNEEARLQDRIHHIIIMIEMGDLREGILPGKLIEFYECALNLPNIGVLGIGSNLGCMSGAIPQPDQLVQLALYRELLELKFKKKLPVISGGSSALLPLLMRGEMPREINHFRIGEALFLGTNLIEGGTLPGLRDDMMILEAEICEIKEKVLSPVLETSPGIATFAQPTAGNADEPRVGQRGFRALVDIGHLDSDITGITPLDTSYSIAGASSDISVVNLGPDSMGLKVGDSINFRINYSALLRLMSSPYVKKVFVPSIDEFFADPHREQVVLPPLGTVHGTSGWEDSPENGVTELEVDAASRRVPGTEGV